MKKKLNIFADNTKDAGCTVIVKAIEPGAKVAKVSVPKPAACLLSNEEQDLITSTYRNEFGTDNDITIGIWDEAFMTV